MVVIVILPAALPGDFQWQARQCFTKPNSLGLSGQAIPRTSLRRLRRLRSFDQRAEKEPSRCPSRRGQGSMKGHLVLRSSNAVFLHTWSCNVAAWCWPTGMKNRNMRLIPKKPGLADENIFFLSQFIRYLMPFGNLPVIIFCSARSMFTFCSCFSILQGHLTPGSQTQGI